MTTSHPPSLAAAGSERWKRYLRPRRITPGVFSWLFSTGLICFLFADVLFLRTSLAPIDYTDLLKRPGGDAPPASFLSERPGRQSHDSQGDIGSAAFQFEPAIKFLAYCIRHGESPFWDPYTGGGTVGPETVADTKFSPFSVTAALFGGSSRAITFCLLALYIISTACILLVCLKHLELSRGAAIATALVYFLNGFALTNLYTAIGQPYFLAPVLLVAILTAVHRPGAGTVTAAVLANVLFLMTTFFPTAVLCLIVVETLALAHTITRNPAAWRRTVLIVAGSQAAAAALVAFLYVPIGAAYSTYLADLGLYRNRSTPGYSLINLISLFTPKHLWESYLAMQMPPTAPPGSYERYVKYLGIAPLLLAFHSPRKRDRLAVVLLAFCLLTAIGQMFGIPPFTLIDRLPFFNFIRNDYWAAMSSLSLAFLCGFAFDSITSRNSFTYPLFALIATMACTFFYVYGHVGMSSSAWARLYVAVFWGILGLTSAILALGTVPRMTRWSKWAIVALVFAEGVFYMNDLRPHRSKRDTVLTPTIAWVKRQIALHPGSRLLNIGETGVFPNWGSALQIPQLGDLNLASPSWYMDFYRRYIGQGLFLSLAYPNNLFTFTDASLSLTGVRYIMVDRDFLAAIGRIKELGYPLVNEDRVRLIYENPHPLPRAFVAGELIQGSDLPTAYGGEVRTTVTSDDAQLIRAAKAARIEVARKSAVPVDAGSAMMVAYHHRLIKLRCRLSRAGLTVLTDTWTPWWRAYVDGVPVHIGRVDMAFRAVVVPRGEHEVVFEYAPTPLRIGEIISLSSLICMLSGLVMYGWKRRLRER